MNISEQKDVMKEGKRLNVSEAEFVDNGGGRIAVNVWQETHHALKSVQAGVGIVIVGCDATQKTCRVVINVDFVKMKAYVLNAK